jgi:uncharacterized protein (DUF1697 family)
LADFVKIFIALFRGINVGGNSTLPMVDLVEILEGLGADNVKTYIQSGNAVFTLDENEISRFAEKISSEVKKRRGFAPKVLVLTSAELEQVMVENPFPDAEADPGSLHVGFLAEPPKNVNLEKLESLKAESEQFQLTQKAFYLYAPDGMGRSRLAAAVEKTLGVEITDRNWRTVCKIREMAVI